VLILDECERNIFIHSCILYEAVDVTPELNKTTCGIISPEQVVHAPDTCSSRSAYATNKGMVRSDMSKPALIFFSLQEYTQQNTLSKF
jgi:hypothetical protein